MVKYKAKFPRIEAEIITVEATDLIDAAAKVLAEREKRVKPTELDIRVDDPSLVSPPK